MKLKKLGSLGSAVVLGISSLSTLAFAPLASAASLPSGTTYVWTGAASSTAGLGGCSSNCMSVAGNWKSTTDGGTTFTDPAAAAPASTDNSGAGANLVFDITNLSAATTVNDDITGLKVGTLSQEGTNSGGYTYNLLGNDFTLTGGTTSYSASGYGSMNVNDAVTFAGDQQYGDPATGNSNINFFGNIAVASGTTLTLNANMFANGTVSGGGTIVVATPPASTTYPHVLTLGNAANTFSGTLEVNKGAQLSITKAAQLGTASLVIADGGQLLIADTPSPAASTDTVTIANDITMAGNGGGVSQQEKGAILASLYDSSKNSTTGTLTVKLTGNVTLAGDTTLASGYDTVTTYNIAGTFAQAGHQLAVVSRDQPTYGATVVQVAGKTVVDGTVAGGATTAAPNTPAPKTPDTGFALASARPEVTLIASVLAAGFIFGIARNLRRGKAVARVASKRR